MENRFISLTKLKLGRYKAAHLQEVNNYGENGDGGQYCHETK